MRVLSIVLPIFSLALILALPSPAMAQRKKDPVAKKLNELRDFTYKALAKTNYFEAKKRAVKWLAYARKRRGATHPDTVRAMQSLAGLYTTTGSRRKAVKLYKELLRIAEKKHGPDSLQTAQALSVLASTAWGAQRLGEAEKIYDRSLKIYFKLYGESEQYAGQLNLLSALYQAQYRFGAAEQVLRKQIKIYRKLDPSGHRELTVRHSIGLLHGRRGDYKRGRAELEKVIAGYEKKFKTDVGLQVAPMMEGIAQLYLYWGKPNWANTLFKRAEKVQLGYIKKLKADPKSHPGSLNAAEQSLARILHRLGKLDEALGIYLRILKAQEATSGKGSLAASGPLYPLSEIYREKGDTAKAREMLKKWADSFARSYGGFAATTPLMFLAELERSVGNYRAAKRLMSKVYKEAAKNWGASHQYAQNYAQMIAFNELGLKAYKRVLRLLENAYAIDKKAIRLKLATGTESDNRTFLAERRHHLHFAVTLHSQFMPKNKRAIRLGLDTALVHKGRLLDASASSIGTLRKKLSKKDRKLLDDLSAARSELAGLVVGGPKTFGGDLEAYGKEIARLEQEVRVLETKVGKRSAAFRATAQPINIKKIQKAIPKPASLIEIVNYRRIDPGARNVVPSGGDRYGAYVLTRRGDPAFVDLGSAKRIDAVVTKFRRELSSSSGSNYKRYGKQLYNLVFAKIEPLLGKRKLVLLAPDGGLNLLPFAALIDQNDKFLVQRFNFSYLSSGRDLLRLAVNVKSKNGAVIFADPSFDDSGKKAPPGKSRGLTSKALNRVKWKKLPGTAIEANAISKMLSDSALWSGKKATETRLKGVKAPRILHLATHGFFLPAEKEAEEPESNATRTPVSVVTNMPTGPGSGQDNPLLRSGLALAGANKLRSGADDGVLTALEAAGLDLWGTKLVVLSACETGVGEISEGEGVYGLRRALVMAGAESMLMSLWQVDDLGTKDLMTGFYKRLAQGKGRSSSLRLVQLRMLSTEKYKHPYYWASFIPSGAWSPISKER